MLPLVVHQNNGVQVQILIFIRENSRKGSVKVRLDKSLKPRPRERVGKSALRKPLKLSTPSPVRGLKFFSRCARTNMNETKMYMQIHFAGTDPRLAGFSPPEDEEESGQPPTPPRAFSGVGARAH